MPDSFFHAIEFHRSAFVLIPDAPQQQYETVLIPAENPKKPPRLFCSCSRGKTPACSHSSRLKELVLGYSAAAGDLLPYEQFKKSLFLKCIDQVTRVQINSLDSITLVAPEDALQPLTVKAGAANLIVYNSTGADRERFYDRLYATREYSRAWLMQRLSRFVESSYEQVMRSGGSKTKNQMFEESVWYWFAYHCFREFAEEEVSFAITVDETDGVVSLAMAHEGRQVCSLLLPRKSVPGVLDVLAQSRRISRAPLYGNDEYELSFRVVPHGGACLRVIPVTAVTEQGETTYYDVKKEFVYTHVGYLPECGRFVKFSFAALQRLAMGWDMPAVIKKAEASDFFVRHTAAFSCGSLQGGEGDTSQADLFGALEGDDFKRLINFPLITRFDRVELHPQTVQGDLWTLRVSYRFGEFLLPLGDLITARQKKTRYTVLDTCMVDLKSSAVLDALVATRGMSADGVIALTGAKLMLLRGNSLSFHIEGDKKLVSRIRNIFDCKPTKKIESIDGLHATLRDYQKLGVTWLLFLYDNNFGGLLCDDMGLGKTIQIIALLIAIKEQRNRQSVACIVAPTSVVSHWVRLLAVFAPGLRVNRYHAADRSFTDSTACDVIITSYGIMRNDVALLEKTKFDVVVFDEIQQLKNRETTSYKMALRLQGALTMGLTGTPIENTIDDLTALFNLVLPGLLADVTVEDSFVQSLDAAVSTVALNRLHRLIEPFMLRRLKSRVLTELPIKIEETRYCEMSDYQRQIYNEALVKRGGPFIDALKQESVPVPYMHIFALLTFLKQLCNTPALASGRLTEYDLEPSGKWDLFTELLEESMGSGQKVVVFTQFVGMVEIFKQYLSRLSIGHVVLTGSTRNRDKVIEQFATDASCRVFIGSLKAGGVGIDLTAASVVIHYDRWWNAAREDQATDRVHRMGQSRGVQVFKLVTEGSVEERINAIINSKRELANRALIEDDPEAIKQFSRADLLDLLS